MKIHKSPLPAGSAVSQYPDIDYSDCFRTTLPGTEPIRPEKLMAAFWTTMPGWLALLFKIRNLLVKPFGLKTGADGNREKLKEALETGHDYGFMSVVGNTDDEMVISLEDKHLAAFFSVYIEDRTVYLTTGTHLFRLDPPVSHDRRKIPVPTGGAATGILTRFVPV